MLKDKKMVKMSINQNVKDDGDKLTRTLEKLKEEVIAEKKSLFKPKVKKEKNSSASSGGGNKVVTVKPKVKHFQKKPNSSVNGDPAGKGQEVKKRKSENKDKDGEPSAPTKKIKKEGGLKDHFVEGEKTDWKAVKKDMKTLKDKRKISDTSAEIFKLSKEAKQLWETLRRGNCEPDVRTKLSKKIYKIIGPHVNRLTYGHDTVRVLETITAVGDDRIKEGIFDSIKNDLLKMSKMKYSNHLIVSFLKHGTENHREQIVKSMEGNIRQLSNNRFGCRILDRIQEDHKELWTGLAVEFYGKEFRVLRETGVNDFKSIVAKHPEKRSIVLKNLKELVLQLIAKNRWDSLWFHKLLCEYLNNATDQTEAEDRTEVIEAVKDELVRIVHTKHGALAAMNCIWFGSTKTRKGIVKSFKGHVCKMAQDEHGYLVLLSLFDSVDDTTLVSKAIVRELLDNFQEMIIPSEEESKSKCVEARKVFIYLVDPRNPVFFHPTIIKLLDQGKDNPISKKDPELRRKELADSTRDSLLPLIPEHISKMQEENAIALFFIAILKSFSDDTRISEIYKRIAKFCCENETAEFVEKVGVSKLLKELIKQDKERHKKGQETFSSVLLDQLDEEIIENWIQVNRAIFLFVFMIETEIEDIVQRTKAYLQKQKALIKKQSFVGAKIVLKHLDNKKK